MGNVDPEFFVKKGCEHLIQTTSCYNIFKAKPTRFPCTTSRQSLPRVVLLWIDVGISSSIWYRCERRQIFVS